MIFVFVFGWRDVPNVSVDPLVVVPVDPDQSGEFNLLNRAPAIIFGFVALNQIKNSDGAQTGRGMAIAGLVLGFIGVGTILFFFIIAAVGSSVSSEFDPIITELGIIVTT